MMKNKKNNDKYSKIIIIMLISIFIFVTIRGFSSYLNQENLRLEKEIHSLGSFVEWIKYEINHEISFSNLEKIAKEKFFMKEIEKEDTIIVTIKKEI